MLNIGFTIMQDEELPGIQYRIEYFVRLRGGKLVSGDIKDVLEEIASDDLRQALEDHARELSEFFKEYLRQLGEDFIEVDFLVFGNELAIFLPSFEEVSPLFSSPDEAIDWFMGYMAYEPNSTTPGP